MNQKLIESSTKSHNKGTVFFSVLTATFGSFFFGYHMSLLSVFSGDPTQMPISGMTQSIFSLTTSLVFLGAALGAMLGGELAQKGRRTALMIADIVGIIGCGTQVIGVVGSVLAGRFISGFAIGIFSCVVPLWINEISPSSVKGSMGTLNQVFICGGLVVADLMGLAVNPNTTPSTSSGYFSFMVGLPIIFAALQLLLFLTVFRLDTPKFYVKQGDNGNAEEILKKIYENDVDAMDILNRLQTEEEESKKKGQMTCGELFSDRFRKRFLVGCGCSVVQQISGINTLLSFAGSIVNGQVFVVIIGVVNLVSGLMSTAVIEKLGRKTMLFWGALFCTVFMFICSFGIMGIETSSTGATSGQQAFVLTGVFAFMLFFGSTLGPVVWLYIPEIVPDKGIGTTTFTNWMMAFLTVLIFGALEAQFQTYQLLFGFVVLNLLGTLFVAIFVKETRNKSEQQIAAEFEGKKIESNESLQSSV